MKSVVEAAAANLVVLVLLYFVVQDVDWRSSCAAAFPPGCRASVASVSYWPFFVVYHLSGDALLKSPPVLDWVQVLLVAIVAFDALFVYRLARSKAHRGLSAKA